jgi:hypothetical protein
MTSNQDEIRIKLFNHTIKNYNIYIDEFINNPELEVAGMIPNNSGFIFYNFFWARASYIHNYCSKPENTPEYIKDERYTWEMWLGKDYCNKKEKVITYSPIIKYNSIYNNEDATYVISIIPFDYDYTNFDNQNILFNIEFNKENIETFKKLMNENCDNVF